VPRRTVLSTAERSALLAIPSDEGDLIRHYTFGEPELARIRQHRGGHNRLGFAVPLCCLRFHGYALPREVAPPDALLAWVTRQLHLEPGLWPQYARRPETRREHLRELQIWLGLTPFGGRQFRAAVHYLTELAVQTDRGIALATALDNFVLHHPFARHCLPLWRGDRRVTRQRRRLAQLLHECDDDARRRDE
jgi:hypothetical protein